MDRSKEIRKILAKYRKFDAQAFRLLKKVTDPQSGDDDSNIYPESRRLCEEIRDILSDLNASTDLQMPSYEFRRLIKQIKPSLSRWIHLMSHRRYVMSKLQEFDRNKKKRKSVSKHLALTK